MAEFVLDASVALAGILPDELLPGAVALLGRVSHGGAAAPSFWPTEVANALLVAERRGRITSSVRTATLADLSQLAVELDAATPRGAWGDASLLAALHGLSVYDGAYLELAVRKTLPLATLDRTLRVAAQAQGVALL